jgi:hypothetical protein
VIVGKVIEEPENEVFSRWNVTVLDETIEIREYYSQCNEKAGSNQID